MYTVKYCIYLGLRCLSMSFITSLQSARNVIRAIPGKSLNVGRNATFLGVLSGVTMAKKVAYFIE